MADDPLLSDLCSICNRNPPKYCCPRDSVRTCSLPCYKRHQQWAQCNGKRDPAAFVKRSDLATPRGIDHDFNFLTGIERGLQRSDEDQGALARDNKKYEHTQARLRPYLQRNRIIVDRAPVGMSRQRLNNTRVTKSGSVRWTVEWLHEDASRDLHEADADRPITDLYSSLLADLSRKRKRTEQASERPTKHNKEEHVSIGAADSHQISVSGQPASQPVADDTQAVPTTVSNSADQSNLDAHSTQQSPPEGSTAVDVSDKAAEDKPDDGNAQTQTPIPSFYLLKPHTPSSQPRVLIPLDSSSTLTAALSSQVVLEYPTIKVLPRQAADAPLPDGFMLEEDYIRQTRQDVKELEALIGPDGQVMTAAKVRRDDDPADGAHGKVSKGAGDTGPVDDKKLLEVLARDLNARK
ncbi:putative hit finger domain protein [Botryosphaeria dothidea]|uniref:Hit finger domain protein n=1 Tax=Botryosphaeria dothidea TaxID=55169 RepID=A0A8H4N903_9PEZI|nr:putative hit finger domain protein [Botryosphaeria dothidea]